MKKGLRDTSPRNCDDDICPGNRIGWGNDKKENNNGQGVLNQNGNANKNNNNGIGKNNRNLRGDTTTATAAVATTTTTQDLDEHGLEVYHQETRKLAAATIGTVKNLVIPIRFADHGSRSIPTKAQLEVLLNNVGPHSTLAPTGSVRDYFLENSYGQFTLDSVVLDWVVSPYTEAQVGGGYSSLKASLIGPFLREALTQVEAMIDFTEYDLDGDGVIDSITFLHSGYGAETGGYDQYNTYYKDRIWSHKWYLGTSYDGIRVNNYHISSSLWGKTGSTIGRIAVIAHETGHFFGLNDLYDTDNSGGEGVGSWGIMGNAWGFDGTQLHPPHMCAFHKIQMGWLTPKTPTYGLNKVDASELKNPLNTQVYKITHGFPSGEYLLVENRQPLGFENVIPQGGLAIWHIDENAATDNNEGYPQQTGWPTNGNHYRIAILQADGNYDLEMGKNRGGSRDVFHGNDIKQLLPSGGDVMAGPFPNTDRYQSGTVATTSNKIYSISPSGNTMTFMYTNAYDTTTACSTNADCIPSDGGDQCTSYTCNTAVALCEISQVADTTPCGDTTGNGVCHLGDHCMAGVCVPKYAASTVVCRGAIGGECDAIEYCTGNSPACPADVSVKDYSLCGNDYPTDDCRTHDKCIAGVCTPQYAPNGQQCGATVNDVCQSQNECSAGTCQPVFMPSTTICRAASGPCDVDDYCSGVSGGCGVDNKKPDNTVCGTNADGLCRLNDHCIAGDCVEQAAPADTVVCRPAANVCDQEEKCDGSSTSCPTDQLIAGCNFCGDGFCNGSETLVDCPQDCSVCGDGSCTGAETLASCPQDCSVCGDGTCSGPEDSTTCVEDCGAVCGDGVCNGDESTANCVADCGSQCGDGVCNGLEDTINCVADCGSHCGDGVCNGSEATTNCPADCGSVCGDGVCNGSEDTANCVADCGSMCGDGVCNGSEGTANCPTDCGSQCGDGVCNGSESTVDCAADCGSHCGDGVCNGSEATTNCPGDCGTSCGDGVCNGNETFDTCDLDCEPICADDPTWGYTRKGDWKDCTEVAKKVDKNCSKVGDDGRLATEGCQETCGTCPKRKRRHLKSPKGSSRKKLRS